MENRKVVPLSFYLNEDVVDISKSLLGKFLFTRIDGLLTGGMIVETESYLGVEDRASHAFNHRKTERTKTLYEKGGRAYVYLCYGMHNMFNVVTNKKDVPHAILIRALEPKFGIDIMMKRRGSKKIIDLCAGPGSLCKALLITKDQNNQSLNSETLWIEDRGIIIKEREIVKSERVGVDYAREWAKLPLRFRIKDNQWCSKAK